MAKALATLRCVHLTAPAVSHTNLLTVTKFVCSHGRISSCLHRFLIQTGDILFEFGAPSHAANVKILSHDIDSCRSILEPL